MLSVIYVSRVAQDFGEADLEPLAAQASAINQAKGITGMLLYNGRHFMQLLEGKQRRVERTLERIARDPRHDELVVIRREEEQPRECPDWSMRCFTVPMTKAGEATMVFQSLPEAFRPDTRVVFTSFASALRTPA